MRYILAVFLALFFAVAPAGAQLWNPTPVSDIVGSTAPRTAPLDLGGYPLKGLEPVTVTYTGTPQIGNAYPMSWWVGAYDTNLYAGVGTKYGPFIGYHTIQENANVPNGLTSITFSGAKVMAEQGSTFYAPLLQTISYPDLEVMVAGWSSMLNTPQLTTVNLPELVVSAGSIGFSAAPKLTTVNVPKLRVIMGGISGFSCGQYTAMSYPALQTIAGSLSCSYDSVVSYSFPELTTISGDWNPVSSSLATTVSFPKLAYVWGTFAGNLPNLAVLSLPELVTVGLGFSPYNFTPLTTLTAPKLTTVGTRGSGGFAPSTMAALNTISMPELTAITNGNLAIATCVNLTTVSMPKLVSLHGTSSMSLPKLTEWSFPELLKITSGGFTFTSAANPGKLATFSMPKVTSINGAVSVVNSVNAGVLTAPVLSTPGTLKYLGGNVSFQGQALTAAGIKALLEVLVSLDGTGGTFSYNSKTITINGGTSAAFATWDATCQGYHNTLEAAPRSCTIVHN